MNLILKSSRSIALFATAVAFGATPTVQADLTKANNTFTLDLATSWTGGTLTPTSADVLIWDATVSGANNVSTAAPLNAAGLRILNPGGLVTLNSTVTNTITLGASGIDMSNATTNNLTLSGAGSILSDAQSWTVAAGRTLTVNNNLNTGSISTLTIGGDGNTTIGAVISTNANTTTINKNGNGTLTISGNQSSGTNRINNLALNSGTLAANHQNVMQGTVTAAGGTTLNSNVGNFLFLNLTATGSISINSGSTRYGSITAGANTLTFLTGTTKNRGASTFNGTTLDVRSGATFQTGDDQVNNTTSSSTITKIGAGTWTLQNGQLSATTGITINAGTLRNNNTNRIADTTAVTIDGSTAVYDLQTNTETVGTVSLKNGGSITGTSTGALTGSSFSLEGGSVSAILTGTGIAVTKTTSGTVTLSGINTYTGGTFVSAGTLALGGSGVIPDVSPVSLGAGILNAATVGTEAAGTLDVTAAATINLATGAKLAFTSGTATWAGSLNITGDFVSGSSLNFGSSSGLSAAQLAAITVNGVGGSFTLDGSGFLSSGGANTAPTITDIANLSVPSGSGTGALAFTIVDEDVNTVTPTGSSSNTTLVPNGNIVFGGSGANRTVTVTPVSGLTGTATITVTVTDAGNLTAQDTFTLTVTPNYLSWATVNGVTGGPNGDSDNDGVTNLVEYSLIDGGERGTLSGNTVTFTKRGAPYGSDVTYDIESSTTLTSWGTLAKPPVVETASSIAYTFTPGSPEKKFARLKVIVAAP